MNSYYVFFQKDKDSNISTYLKRWEIKFENYKEIVSFISEDVFQEGNIVENLINCAREKKLSFDGVYELVFLPLILEPDNLRETYSQLKQIQKELESRITSDRLANVFLFPLIKIQKEESKSLEKEGFKGILDERNKAPSGDLVKTKFLPFFLFQNERISLAPYDNENWLCDIENFITFLPIIENKGLHFFNYFPNSAEREIGTFVSNIYLSKKYEEIIGYLTQSLNEWITYQTIEDSECRDVLIDSNDEIDKIKQIGLGYTETVEKHENEIIEKFKFFGSLKFSTIKNNLEEFRQLDIDEKIANEASNCEHLIKKISLLEYQDRVANLKKSLQKDSVNMLSMTLDKLVSNQSNVNCLIKESEKNIGKSLLLGEIQDKFFGFSLSEKIKELNLKGLFKSILDEMTEYLKGVPFRTKLYIFLITYILSAAIIYQTFDMSGIPLKIYLLFIFCFIPAIAAPLLYTRYWIRKKEQKIKMIIREFRKRLTNEIQTSIQESMRNNVALYFCRFIQRKALSIKEHYEDVKRLLVSLKDYLLDIKAMEKENLSGHPPKEMKEKIEKVNFNKIFSDVKNYDSFTISDFFNNLIKKEAERIYVEMKFDDEIDFGKIVEEDLSKKATINLDEKKVSKIFLVPDSLDERCYQGIKEKTYYKIPIRGRAIALLIGKIKI